jgi:predicted XRE-type DNA-binding protein
MEEFDPVDAAKTVFIVGIANRIRSQYRSQVEAADQLQIDQGVISRLCSGKTHRFSLAWLVSLADKLGADVYIKVK